MTVCTRMSGLKTVPQYQCDGFQLNKGLVTGAKSMSYTYSADPCPWGNNPKSVERWNVLQITDRWLKAEQARRGALRCGYCNAGPLRIYHWIEQQGHDVATVDHVIPRAMGGPDSPANFKVACRPCNARKGASMPQGQWAALLAACSSVWPRNRAV
ncbi:MAG: hypothetical protein J3K34DRAFT_456681 [Monoraphidium minutum]|nr:MAG: hypothetical protein J3K34DRAFT_456681 [Monoraphidium minutum]